MVAVRDSVLCSVRLLQLQFAAATQDCLITLPVATSNQALILCK